MTRVVIGLGANLGDREATMQSAVEQLRNASGIEQVTLSPVVETVAVVSGGPDPSRPRYLNAVAFVDTTLDPHRLLTLLHRIEADHGRTRPAERWSDRTLDLDIIDIPGVELHDADLVLPHPGAHEREFVLRPWLELDADAVLTGHGRVAELLRRIHAAEPEFAPGVATDATGDPDGGTR